MNERRIINCIVLGLCLIVMVGSAIKGNILLTMLAVATIGLGVHAEYYETKIEKKKASKRCQK